MTTVKDFSNTVSVHVAREDTWYFATLLPFRILWGPKIKSCNAFRFLWAVDAYCNTRLIPIFCIQMHDMRPAHLILGWSEAHSEFFYVLANTLKNSNLNFFF